MASRCKLKTRILYDFPRYEIVIILKREKNLYVLLSYHSLEQAHSMFRHSGRWRDETPSAQTQGHNEKWCVHQSDETDPL